MILTDCFDTWFPISSVELESEPCKPSMEIMEGFGTVWDIEIDASDSDLGEECSLTL